MIMKRENFFKVLVASAMLLFAGVGFGQDDGGGDGEGDCACVKKIVRGAIVTYVNISVLSESNSSLVMLEDCDKAADPCEGECKYAEKVAHVGWQIKTGKCMDWGVVSEEIVEDGRSVSTNETEIVVTDMETISFYPNPATDFITVNGDGNVVTSIYTLTGELVIETTERQIDLGQLDAGSYIVNMNNGSVITREQLVVN